MLSEKENYKYLGMLEGDTIKQMEMKEKIKKASQNQVLQQESHQRDKHIGCSPCKVLGTNLEMYERRTSTNRPEDKKTNDDAQGFTSKRLHRQTICV